MCGIIETWEKEWNKQHRWCLLVSGLWRILSETDFFSIDPIMQCKIVAPTVSLYICKSRKMEFELSEAFKAFESLRPCAWKLYVCLWVLVAPVFVSLVWCLYVFGPQLGLLVRSLRGPRIDRNVGLAACLLNAEWKTVVSELIAKCRAMQQIQAAWDCVQIKSNYSCAGSNTVMH